MSKETLIDRLIAIFAVVIVILGVVLFTVNSRVNTDGDGDITEIYYSRDNSGVEPEMHEKFEIYIKPESFKIIQTTKNGENTKEYEVVSDEDNYNEIIRYFRSLNIRSTDGNFDGCTGGQVYKLAIKGENPFEGNYSSCGRGSLTNDPYKLEIFLRDQYDLREPVKETTKK